MEQQMDQPQVNLEDYSLSKLGIKKKDLKYLETEYAPEILEEFKKMKTKIENKNTLQLFEKDKAAENILKNIQSEPQKQIFSVSKQSRRIQYIDYINQKIQAKVQQNQELTCKEILRQRFRDSIMTRQYFFLPVNQLDYDKICQIVYQPQQLEQTLEMYLIATYKKKSRLINFFSSQLLYDSQNQLKPVEIEQMPQVQGQDQGQGQVLICICSINYEGFISKFLQKPIISEYIPSKKQFSEILYLYLQDEYLKQKKSSQKEIILQDNLQKVYNSYPNVINSRFTQIQLTGNSGNYQTFKSAQISGNTSFQKDVNKDPKIFNNYLHPIILSRLVEVYSEVILQIQEYCRILQQPMENPGNLETIKNEIVQSEQQQQQPANPPKKKTNIKIVSKQQQ